MSDNLVPEPHLRVRFGEQGSGRRGGGAPRDGDPQLAAGFPNGHPAPKSDGGVEMCACGRHPKSECEDGEHSSEDDIPLKAIDDIGRATAEDVKEALHQVIDPELGIDVIDLGLVYGIEIDELGRAIITMTLTTPHAR